VRQEIVDAMTRAQSSAAALAAADAALKRLQQGDSFDTVAKSLDVMAMPAAFVGRSDPQVPAQVRDAAFAAPVPGAKPVYQALTLDDGGAALFAVSAVKPGQPGVNSKNDEQLVESYMRRDSDGEMAAYVLDLQRLAHVQRNPDVFQ
jgi:peptidyl-prolyl cis-trans isomerase D